MSLQNVPLVRILIHVPVANEDEICYLAIRGGSDARRAF